MTRAVVVATVVSMLMAVAASALYVPTQFEEIESERVQLIQRTIEARAKAAEAAQGIGALSAAIDLRAGFANEKAEEAQAAVADLSRQVAGIREELDAMQTQIRLLKLAR